MILKNICENPIGLKFQNSQNFEMYQVSNIYNTTHIRALYNYESEGDRMNIRTNRKIKPKHKYLDPFQELKFQLFHFPDDEDENSNKYRNDDELQRTNKRRKVQNNKS